MVGKNATPNAVAVAIFMDSEALLSSYRRGNS